MKTLQGLPLSAYRIFYDGESAAAAQVAQRLCGWLLRDHAVRLPVQAGTAAGGCILLGGTAAHYGDGALCELDGNICVMGADVAGLTAAAAQLVACLAASGGDCRISTTPMRFSLQERAEYERDATAFLPTYHGALHVEERELTLARKRAVLRDVRERPFVIAHRGEHVFYPENSLEGAISTWRCGADSVEVDIQRSADGVWMCMHDSNVMRTTNAADFIGKAGYPASEQLCDWSFAQLRTLRLRDAYGALTPFPIPTLQEILHACDGRIYLHLDKRFDVESDVFPEMEREGVLDCVYLCNHVSFCMVPTYRKHFAARGVILENMTRPRGTQSAEDVIAEMLPCFPDVTPAMIPLGDYIKHGAHERALIARYGDRIRFGAWFLRDFDDEMFWRTARAEGIGIFMTDHPIDLIALSL